MKQGSSASTKKNFENGFPIVRSARIPSHVICSLCVPECGPFLYCPIHLAPYLGERGTRSWKIGGRWVN